MKRILVTGATGFIGRHTLQALSGKGFEVHAISSKPRSSARDGILWHQADLLDLASVSPLLGRVRATHLLHLAWFAVPGQFWNAPVNLRWVQATLELLQSFVAAGGHRVVAAGTCAEYQTSDVDCDEWRTPLRPDTLYGVCKHSAHVMMEKFAEERLSAAWGKNLSSIRAPPAVESVGAFGDRQPARRRAGALHPGHPGTGFLARDRRCRRICFFARQPGPRAGEHRIRLADFRRRARLDHRSADGS